jgi:hypothetical protein
MLFLRSDLLFLVKKFAYSSGSLKKDAQIFVENSTGLVGLRVTGPRLPAMYASLLNRIKVMKPVAEIRAGTAELCEVCDAVGDILQHPHQKTQTSGHVHSSSLPFAKSHFAPVRFTSPRCFPRLIGQTMTYPVLAGPLQDFAARCPLLTPCFVAYSSFCIGQCGGPGGLTTAKGSRCSNP